MFNQTPGKVLKLIQGNKPESTSSEKEESSVYSINSGSWFHFNLDGSIVIENIVLGVHSSFEKHPIGVNQLSEFKIKPRERIST